MSLPSFLLFFFFIIILSFTPTCLSEDDEAFTKCAPLKFLCGNNLYEIRYPFGVDVPDRPSYCSYPGYNLTCTDDGNLFADALSNNFTIKNITYSTNVLHIVDADFTTGGCPLPLRNSTIGSFTFSYRNQVRRQTDVPRSTIHLFPFNYTNEVLNVTLYVNCEAPLTAWINSSNLHELPCLTSIGNYTYFTLQPLIMSEVQRIGFWEIVGGYCRGPVIIPLLKSAANRLLGDGGENFGAVLESGFNVQWMVGTSWCAGCENSGGRCGYNESNPFEATCFCRDGKQSSTCSRTSWCAGCENSGGRCGYNESKATCFCRDGKQSSTCSRTSWCAGCENSGGRCGYNESNPFEATCFCQDGKQSSTCSSKNNSGKVIKNNSGKVIKPIIGKNNSGEVINGKVIKATIGTVSGAIILILACIVFVFFIRKSVKRTNDSKNNATAFSLWQRPVKNVEAFLQNCGSLAPKRYRYSKLKKITNSFKDKLGEGGYGGVFKGKLKGGRLVAVKVLNNSKGNGEEFINEVASIGRTYHVNIVTLLGFCYEGSKRALIYEFMSNGSLEKFIYSNKLEGAQRALTCERLFQIAVGIARGLEYLHRGCSTRILHFDIKPHNILLDDEFCPKISDFGLAKLCPKHESIISMQDARGTTGYIAPEVYCRNIGGVSHKSDVYSYGMMVLEMVGGRKNIDAQAENTSEIYFPHWVYNHIALEDSFELIGILEEEEREIARKMVLVGLWCIQTNPTNRPSVSKVVEMLEGSVQGLEMPPKPYLSSP